MRRHLHSINAAKTVERLQTAIKKEYAEPKFCKDCEWHKFERVVKKDDYGYRHYCTCPPLLDMITGQPSNPIKNRNTETICGKDAKYFSKRSTEADNQR